jgi:hypothetical protein
VTKFRTPLTFPDAITRVAGVLTFKGMANLLSRSDRCVRNWSDPETMASPSLAQALTLDAAYRLAGGDGSPILEAYAFQLDAQITELSACTSALAADLGIAARECGEAISSAVAVTQGGASISEVHCALVESEQARSALAQVIERLKSFLSRGAGPRGECSGRATA